MTSDLASRAKHLFHEALELPEAERAAFLAARCGEDSALRLEVESLLGAHASLAPEPAAKGERAGDTIGHYKLLQEIGAGGFGTVWMAEQHEPVRRKVALKILKWGMDTAQVVARFEAERQALALMDHENIAKVFDGGATEHGRPYFVMELVRGMPITEYCDAIELPLRERLELFAAVCQAVQHAHQKGVIHRDLKPSNVLVTVRDGVPMPKVIDFGIAKATYAELTTKTLFTEFRQMIGTPEYMAPEQAEISAIDVDTRADVYSLGVLLYELLTGGTPFARAKLLQAGYAEMLRHIREVDPPTPSTRVATLGEQLFDVARHRGVQPRAFGSALKGELDWIVMKALDKERDRRYPTAAAFAEDVGRCLRDEPVLASPPSRLYRWRKYVRRHRVGVLAGALVTTSLVAGLALASWGYLEASEQTELARVAEDEATIQKNVAVAAEAEERAQRELAEAREREAQTQATKAETVIELLQKMLSSSDPHATKGPGYTVRELLDDFDHELGTSLETEPAVEVVVRRTMGQSYLGLGLPDEAERNHRRALEILRRLHGDEHPRVASALNNLANVLKLKGDLLGAERCYEEALAMQRELLGEENESVANILANLGKVLDAKGDLAGAKRRCREALAMQRRLRGEEDERVATALYNLGEVLCKEGDLAGAEQHVREALAMRRRLFGDEHPQLAVSLESLGNVLRKRGDLAGAERCLRDALAMQRSLLGDEHPNMAVTLNSLGAVLREKGDLAGAERYFRGALAMHRKLFGEEHPDVATSLNNLGGVLGEKGDLPGAERHLREGLAMLRKLLGDDHPDLANGLGHLGSVLSKKDDVVGAERCYEEALSITRRRFGDGHPSVAVYLNKLAYLDFGRDDFEGAVRRLRTALAIQRERLGDQHPEVALNLSNLAAVLLRMGERDEARELWRQAYALQPSLRYRQLLAAARKRHGDSHPEVATALVQLAGVLLHEDQPEEAEPLAREALEICRAKMPDSQLLARAQSLLGGSLLATGRCAEAEPLALEGYERLTTLSAPTKTRREALERIVRLYEAWDKPEQAETWRQKLGAAGSPEPDRK